MTPASPTVTETPAPTLAPVEPDADEPASLPRYGTHDRPLRGILLIVASTVFLASSDVMAKYLTMRLPTIEVAWIRFLVFFLIMLPAIAAAPRRTLRTTRPKLQVLRGLTLVGSSLLFMSSLRVLPIAEATTTAFVSPIFVTLLSVAFLGETVGLRRWIATFAGLIGVAIVVRPGTSAFQPGALLAMASAALWACALVATRRIAGHDSSRTTMAYAAIFAVGVLSLLLPFAWTPPTLAELGIGACIGLAATFGHWLVVLAYRYGDASVLAPLTYVQAIWATLFGYVFFGNIPDVYTFVGGGVIIGSGLYIAHRERLRRAAMA